MSRNDIPDKLSHETIAVHGGERREEQPFGAVVSPVFHSATFSFSSFAEMRRYARGELTEAYFYSRYANPTIAEVERSIARLEGAEACVVTSSGSAATFCTLLALCEPGDEIIACDSIYGGTTKLLTKVLARFGVQVRFIPLSEVPRLVEHCNPRTRVFWCETPANPINRLVDLAQVAQALLDTGVTSVVDNTFATPILQRPLFFGINAVMHSATKYMGGHSDLTAGAVAGSRKLINSIREISVAIGATLDPAAAYLLGRGLKTLHLRVQASSTNALKLAQSLSDHPKVSRVYYPALETDPGHELVKRQMNGAAGGIVAFDVAGGEPEVERMFDALRLVRPAPSLGGVESLISYPRYSSHASFSAEQLRAAGVSASTVRIALGVEAADDIINDVLQALARI